MNYIAVIGSAIASIIIGSVWYGPLFGNKFRQLIGVDQWSPEKQAQEKKKMGQLYAVQLAASLVMFYVLSVFIDRTGSAGIAQGISTSLLVWIGFVVPVQLGGAIWGGNLRLFYLAAGNMLLTLLAAGAITGALG